MKAHRAAKLLPCILLMTAQPVESMEDGKKAAVITDVTAFHAEGGGQLGDTGRIIAPAGVMQVEITKNCRTAQPL